MHFTYAILGWIFFSSTCLINKIPISILNDKTPLEALFQKIHDYSSLKVFGCLWYSYLRPNNSHRLKPKSLACKYIGYTLKNKGCKCLASNGKLYIRRNIDIGENQYCLLLNFTHCLFMKKHPSILYYLSLKNMFLLVSLACLFTIFDWVVTICFWIFTPIILFLASSIIHKRT